jgi:hypothetical protein
MCNTLNKANVTVRVISSILLKIITSDAKCFMRHENEQLENTIYNP